MWWMKVNYECDEWNLNMNMMNESEWEVIGNEWMNLH